MAAPAYQAALYDGNYELGYGSETGGPTPYYELRQWLYGPNTAPIGQAGRVRTSSGTPTRRPTR